MKIANLGEVGTERVYWSKQILSNILDSYERKADFANVFGKGAQKLQIYCVGKSINWV